MSRIWVAVLPSTCISRTRRPPPSLSMKTEGNAWNARGGDEDVAEKLKDLRVA